MKDMSKKSFDVCPKCGAEVDHIKLGSLFVEKCPECKGIFLDYKELKQEGVKKFFDVYQQKRGDKEVLDVLEIECPKCKKPMLKTKAGASSKLILDVCPECKGVWFDYGELERFRCSRLGIFKKPKRLIIKLVCDDCKITTDYTGEYPKKCPHCNKLLSFEGVGEVVEKRFAQKEIATIILGSVLLLVVYGLAFSFFKKHFHATLFTGTAGLAGVIVLIRALVWNKFAWASGRTGIVADFNIPES